MLIIEGEAQEIDLEFRLIEQAESSFSQTIDIVDSQPTDNCDPALEQA